MSSGLLSIGVSGLAAAQLGLLTTEHNVTNASTPGYTRQRTVQTSLVGIQTGGGTVGQGTDVVTIERMYDKYLSAQVNSSQTKLSETDAYYAQISQIDNLMADPAAGLSPALQEFFKGVQDVAANPSLLSSRQAMISSAETLVSRFQSLDMRLDELNNEVNGRIEDNVGLINSYAKQIAELNQRIVIAESSYGQPANDMLDQRGQLINELNKLIKVTTPSSTNSGLNVFIGSGQPLVIGTQTMEMTATPSTADASRMVIGIKTSAAGASVELPDSLVIGGELGGLVKFRNEVLGSTTNELGRLAASMALTFNAQQALGQDLLGRAGTETGFETEFFSMAALKPTVIANTSNTGTKTISVSFADPSFGGTDGNFYTNLTTSDYLLTKTGAGYTLTRLDDNEQWSGADIPALSGLVSSEGLSISLSSTGAAHVAGDSFLIQPTRNAAENLAVNAVIAADPRTIAAALPFRTTSTASNTGSGAISAGTGAQGFNLSSLATPITFTFVSGSPNTLTYAGGASGSVNYTSGMTISVSGMSFVMTGVPNNGDSFKLERNTAATTDGRNALALGKLQTQNTVAGGSATFQTAFAQTVADIGIKTRELRVVGAAQESALNQAQISRDTLSGVNLDEEAANMIRYQQAYQASAKILDIGSQLFDTLLQLG